MPDVSITFDAAQLKRAQAALQAVGKPNGIKLAARRAVERTGRAVRSELAGHLAQATGLPKNEVRRYYTRMSVNRADMSATVTAKARAIPLRRLRPRQNKRGVTYKTPAGRELRPGAFIATMPSGHWGVFRRADRPRLPIREQYGPSITDIIGPKLPAIRTDAAARLAHELDGQIRMMLEKAKR